MLPKRIALGIEYNGSGFYGWQSQTDGNTVQDALEVALAEFTGEACAVTCAGRTDAGVHAYGQVVHLDTQLVRDMQSWVRGTNRYLDHRVRVLWAAPIADDFHARFSAQSRAYHYVLLNDAVGPGLFAANMAWVHQPLDLSAMQQCAQLLLGTHDFSAFRAAQCQAKSPVRTMQTLQLTRRGNIIHAQFQANAFLHHMIRNIMGSLVYVGSGRCDTQWFMRVLEARDRRLAAPTLAAEGLYLTHIEYPPSFGLDILQQHSKNRNIFETIS
jgi:tRNA pseudouridine38-40 synthase